jgi:hypothetical protein
MADDIVGVLARRLVETHMVNHEAQIRAWQAQIMLLQRVLIDFPHWHILFEYPLLRLGRRIDVVVLTNRAIFVIEFKVGEVSFPAAACRQVEDYALDLFDFHVGSRNHPIVPVLVATEARIVSCAPPLIWHGIAPVMQANAKTLGNLLADVDAAILHPAMVLNPAVWEQAPYRPVPTIVEAATMLYRKHGVADIAAARADIGNLTHTTTIIHNEIAAAKAGGHHMILFVTGIPGAGKTLCGLNAVFHAGQEAAFLTGNLPLVHVLREALARDAAKGDTSLRLARHRVESAVQPLLGFLRDNVQRADPPHEHVIVFDEAQRAWDAAFGRRKFGLDDSEAALFLDIMRRHQDWSVIVALVGSGQEINTGEAGLASWGTALAARPEWCIAGPPDVIGAHDPARCLFPVKPHAMTIEAALHLDVSVRQIRSPAAAAWIDAVLTGDAGGAAMIARQAGGVPFRLTRSPTIMRNELRRLARGTRRAGLVCSADAKRLRAEGLSPDFPHLDQDAVANWFLNRWPDVRASDALEMPATQYACQGLELDYVGVCWGGDLLRHPERIAWQARKFKGTKWQEIRRAEAVNWQVNTYRVLLTRARYETIIFVPNGDSGDITRNPDSLNDVAGFLVQCGAEMLKPAEDVAAVEPLQLALL